MTNTKGIPGDLIENIDKIHTTELGAKRIIKNLGLKTDDIIGWCVRGIYSADDIFRKGKNWYVCTSDAIITINAGSYTIITAHKKNPIST